MNMTASSGDQAAVTHTVAPADTAEALRSGDLAVLGTPAMLAWSEEATCAVLDLDNAVTSVGTKVSINHIAPSPVGAVITVTATVVLVAGRTISFDVVAVDEAERTVGHGQVQRAIVDRARFMGRLEK